MAVVPDRQGFPNDALRDVRVQASKADVFHLELKVARAEVRAPVGEDARDGLSPSPVVDHNPVLGPESGQLPHLAKGDPRRAGLEGPEVRSLVFGLLGLGAAARASRARGRGRK